MHLRIWRTQSKSGENFIQIAKKDYDLVLSLNANELEPFVTWGTNPEMGVPVNGRFPEINNPNDQQAYEYMELKPG